MECGMGRRFHRGFTAAEKTELWDRWKRGESLKAIGRAFGKPSSSIYFLVAPHGGSRPPQRGWRPPCLHELCNDKPGAATRGNPHCIGVGGEPLSNHRHGKYK